ncbi:MAG: hypothetical protein M1825_003564 [Sarcosagium campestre]|nr:MAG: hypothetical protein M1825_003564 [Sarcosagium campestre]
MASGSPSLSGSSSPLSSVPSLSPTPPWYPSPPSSQDLPAFNDQNDGGLPLLDSTGDGQPPSKKRRLREPKERLTQYLDLRGPTVQHDDQAYSHSQDQVSQLDLLLNTLRGRRKIVVIAGAGISVSAGVPDFRSSKGLFTTLRGKHNVKSSGKHLFDASVYKTDASTASFHDMVRSLSHLVSTSKPTVFHHMLATLAQEGRLLRLYSQNVDGIDTSLLPLATNVPLPPRGPWPRTIQLHGGLEKMVCSKCHTLSNFEPSLFEGPEAPSCTDCEQLDSVRTTIAGKRSHGIGKLRPRILLYNEYNPDEEAIGAVTRADLKARPDAVIVAGTSLKVPGVRRIVREMCSVVRSRRNGVTIWINNDLEPVGKEFENSWDLIVRAECDEVARRADFPHWDELDIGEFTEVGPDDLDRAKEKSQPEVVVQTLRKTKGAKQIQGVWTPVESRHGSTLSNFEATGKPSNGILKAPAIAQSVKHQRILPVKTSKQQRKPRDPAKKRVPKQKRDLSGVAKINVSFKVSKAVNAGVEEKETFAIGNSDIKVKQVADQGPSNSTEGETPPPTSISTVMMSEASHQCPAPLDDAPNISVGESPISTREEIVSPKGNLPENLARLLN